MSTQTKPSTKLTYAQYALIPEDGCRHEIMDGVHVVNPAPSLYHQTVSRKIQFQLFTQIEIAGLGVVFDAPVDLQLSDHDIVQPDLVVVLNSRKTILTPTKIKGVPDLVVEILSPSSDYRDQVDKKQLYQKSGIPEYWIVDPSEHTLAQYVLVNSQYVEKTHGEIVSPTILEEVNVDLQQVW